jgi:putative endopeptidase
MIGKSARWVLIGLVCIYFSTAAASAAETTLKSGVDRADLDSAVKPGDDFFAYVNGAWLKKNPIPAEYSRWGAFSKLRDDNLVALREILDGLVNGRGLNTEEAKKLRDFYQTAMNEEQLESQAAKPLAAWFDKIAKVKSPDEIISLAGELRATGISSLFAFSVDQDEKQSSRYAVQLWQDGMGLPERDYYLGTSDDSKRIRDAYREHVTKMFTLLGDSPEAAAKGADAVLRIETQLAEKSRTPVEQRDREANYNRMSTKELAALTPNVHWDRYWRAVDVQGVDDTIVGQPEFFERVNELLTSVPSEDWRAYLGWHLIHSTAPYLSNAFEQENFNFYSKTLRGVKEMQPRWKRAVNTVDRQMGEALGKMYVAKYFKPEAKKRMDELVKNLMLAYRNRLETRDWMGPETKEQALAKLSTVRPKIGYPDKWRDYSALEIKPDSYVQNVLRAEAFESKRRIARLHKPVDRDEWDMTPPTVNAYYNPVNNEIVFPAGILQPPFFNAEADDAVNYGSIGAVIGHEITHGFDDQGSRSDAEGNLRNWWTADDRARFKAKTDELVKQYNACNPIDDLHINGALTLGENLADLGGVTIAYAAYEKSLDGKQPPVIDGLSGPQRFFMGYAQSWRESIRDAELKLMLRTNPHSPDKYRTLVPLSNVAAFYEAFDVKPGQAMYRAPTERVEVW